MIRSKGLSWTVFTMSVVLVVVVLVVVVGDWWVNAESDSTMEYDLGVTTDIVDVGWRLIGNNGTTRIGIMVSKTMSINDIMITWMRIWDGFGHIVVVVWFIMLRRRWWLVPPLPFRVGWWWWWWFVCVVIILISLTLMKSFSLSVSRDDSKIGMGWSIESQCAPATNWMYMPCWLVYSIIDVSIYIYIYIFVQVEPK